ncbi:protein tyrosine phosphatase [Cephaloticoccus primus]|uniref:protein-tyrosine-phosphatase n=1 Tax=Cephaloticoccus primus TaxID=1548207 RepID=A0A139SII4_9BACT|nr:protein tyrosine phosphatase [Cephaloticoccus primus]KXU34382.1 protein tyrosine phosphatase [Cephaloticoccus primus]
MSENTTGSIVVVCTANICRSPMGEGLLRHALAAEAEPLRSIPIISAGVAARAGVAVSENSVFALKKVGIDIAAHKSQPVTQAMLDQALLILCMTEAHRAMIRHQAKPVPRELRLFREFMPAGNRREIADPYGGPSALYEACRDELVEAIPSLLAHIKELCAAKSA